MIKITSVEIDGFIIPSQKVKLDFVESNVVCIYGNNGAGKTSFLEILFAVFSRDGDILEKYNVDKIVITILNEDSPITVERIKDTDKWRSILKREIEGDTDVGTYIENIKSKYYWGEVEQSSLENISSLFLGIGRGIHKKELKIPRNRLWHFFNANRDIDENKRLTGNEIDDFSDKLAEYLMPTKERSSEAEAYEAKELDGVKNVYLPSIDIDTIEAFLNNKYKEAVVDAKEKIEKTLSQTSLNFFQTTVSDEIDLEELRDKLIYNKTLLLEMFSNTENIGIKTVFDSLDKNENFLKEIDSSKQIILSNIVKELQSEVELFNEIKIFLDEYNQFLNYGKSLILSANGIYITPENHSIQKLSSGERHLLTFLATILLMGEEQDFILLDEPEISLNVDWQTKILSVIEKLAPNSQIIVATHSPLVVEEYPQSLVEIEPMRS